MFCTCEIKAGTSVKKLDLGITKFPHKKAESVVDPLADIFKDEQYSFENPITKLREKLPIFYIITTQSHVNKTSAGKFKMFPPVPLPKPDLAPGFPKQLHDELSDNFLYCHDPENKWQNKAACDDAEREYHKRLSGCNTESQQREIKTKDILLKSNTEYKYQFKQAYFDGFCAHQAEVNVVEALSWMFTSKDIPGFMIQSYHSETYLQPLVNRVKKQRQNNEFLKFTNLQEKIFNATGTSSEECKKQVEIFLDTVDNMDLTADIPIIKEIKKIDIEAQAHKKYRQSSKVDKINYVMNKLYNLRVKGLETDVVLVLQREKQVIFVETKSLTKGVLKNALTHAAEQLELRRKVFINCHKDILSDEWSFVKVIALPFINKDTKLADENINVCGYCRRFIIDEEDSRNISKWFSNIISEEFTSEDTRDYNQIFNRLVGFMSISDQFGLSSNVFLSSCKAARLFERSILGSEIGITSEKAEVETISREISAISLQKQPLSSLQVLYFWNEEQLQFLLAEEKKVFFMSDFGVGKTLMKKHMALKLAKENCKVIFLSLASVKRDEHKMENLQFYKSPSIFDLSTEIDFKDTNVIFLSLCDFLRRMQTSFENMDPSNIVMRFMKENEDCHFFIDEFPVSYTRTSSIETFMNYLEERSEEMPEQFIWITYREGFK